MNAEECEKRASDCAANAAIAPAEPLALEFLKLAAQWRAMAVRQIFLGRVGEVDVPLPVQPRLAPLA
jgi:hypothetical protein